MSNLAIVDVSLPSAIEAEQALLGMVLMDNAVAARLCETITADSFGEPYHATLWQLTTDLIGRGRLAEPTALAERLRGDPVFEMCGGLAALADMMDKAPRLTLAGDYAQRVADASRRREIIRLAGEAAQAARDPAREPFDILTETEGALSALAVAAAPDGHTLIDARLASEDLVRELDHEAETGYSPGILVGIDCVDVALQGLFPNELLILAGRPSMGKTALARAIAFAAARKHPDMLVPFFALEMDRRQISRRNLSQLSHEANKGIPYRYMKRGRDMAGEDRAVLSDMSQRVPRNLVLDDTAVLSIEHVERRLLALSRRGPIKLAVIDYLQIMDLTSLLRSGMNLTTALGMVTGRLKRLAKQIGCCIILLSQLSRKCEERDNKRPQLGDLRDSGSIEQDASAVIFCYRDAYYLEREGPRKGTSRDEHEMAVQSAYRTMEVILAKSREGPVGTTRQRYLAEFDVIENVEAYQ